MSCLTPVASAHRRGDGDMLQRRVRAGLLLAVVVALSVPGTCQPAVAQVRSPVLAPPVPAVGDERTTFQVSGTGFTPGATATVMVSAPSGAPYGQITDPTLHIGTLGRLTWRWTWRRGDQIGTYRVSIVDDKTHVTSNEVNFEIRTHQRPALWRRLLPKLIVGLPGIAMIGIAIADTHPKDKHWKMLHYAGAFVGALLVIVGAFV